MGGYYAHIHNSLNQDHKILGDLNLALKHRTLNFEINDNDYKKRRFIHVKIIALCFRLVMTIIKLSQFQLKI